MSGGFVADASVGVAWAVPAEASSATDRLLDEVASGAALVVPVLWPLEIANCLLALVRRRRILAADCDQALDAKGYGPCLTTPARHP